MFTASVLLFIWIFNGFSSVAGHGFVHSLVINDQEFSGWNPFTDPYTASPPKIVRKIPNDGFVAVDDPNLPCHQGGNDGTPLVADVTAGNQVIFRWAYWPADHQGPVSTYMASCNSDCTTFLASDAKWFKVDASGYDPATRQWAADKLRANNNSWVSTIPKGLASGQYLMRNEIIALHSVTPQFYPSCAQVKVNGAEAGQPSEDELVSIPGLYSNVTWPNIYSDFGTFSIPGPPPPTFGVGGKVTTVNPVVTSPRPTATAGTSRIPSSSAAATSVAIRYRVGSAAPLIVLPYYYDLF